MFVDQRSQSLNLCALAHVVKWKLEILGWKAWGEDKVNNAEAGGEVKCLKYLERERGRLSGTDCHERVSQTTPNFGMAADFCTPVMLFPDKFRVWNCKRFFPASRHARVNDRVHVGYPSIWTLDSLLSCGHWDCVWHVENPCADIRFCIQCCFNKFPIGNWSCSTTLTTLTFLHSEVVEEWSKMIQTILW